MEYQCARVLVIFQVFASYCNGKISHLQHIRVKSVIITKGVKKATKI